MKRRELLKVWRALQAVPSGTVGGARFNYAVAMNRRKLRPIVESLQEAAKLPPDLEEFERARVAIGVKHAIRDPRGEAVVSGENIMLANPAAYHAEFGALCAAAPGLRERVEQHRADYERMLDEDVRADDVAFETWAVDETPDLPTAVFDGLFDLLVGS